MNKFTNRSALILLLSVIPSALPADEGEPGSESYEPGIELPEGEGRELLVNACTKCHDLKGLPAYQGYWGRQRWRNMVETMVKNGASLDESQVAVVTDYLTEFFGPGTR